MKSKKELKRGDGKHDFESLRKRKSGIAKDFEEFVFAGIICRALKGNRIKKTFNISRLSVDLEDAVPKSNHSRKL
jgi:hypothetical protein